MPYEDEASYKAKEKLGGPKMKSPAKDRLKFMRDSKNRHIVNDHNRRHDEGETHNENYQWEEKSGTKMKSGFKMKSGSPFQRNFGISPVKAKDSTEHSHDDHHMLEEESRGLFTPTGRGPKMKSPVKDAGYLHFPKCEMKSKEQRLKAIKLHNKTYGPKHTSHDVDIMGNPVPMKSPVKGYQKFSSPYEGDAGKKIDHNKKYHETKDGKVITKSGHPDHEEE